jgi:tetratricopeptide (TPR) repeat protein
LLRKGPEFNPTQWIGVYPLNPSKPAKRFSSAIAEATGRKPIEREAPKSDRDRALELIKRGMDFLAAGDLKGAWNQFILALQADPECQEAYYEMGRFQQGLGNLTAADRFYKQALGERLGRVGKPQKPSTPPLLDAHIGRGMIAWEKKAWSNAIEHFDRAVSQGFEPSDSLRPVIGECLLRLGRFSEATEEFEKAPWHIEGLMNFGLALYILGDLDRAAATLRRFFLLNPDPPEMLSGFAFREKARTLPSTKSNDVDTEDGSGVPSAYFKEPDRSSRGYWDRCRDLWKNTPGALEFLSALWMDPQVAEELEETRRIEMALQITGDCPEQTRFQKKLNRLRSPVRIHNSQSYLLQRLSKQLS